MQKNGPTFVCAGVNRLHRVTSQTMNDEYADHDQAQTAAVCFRNWANVSHRCL